MENFLNLYHDIDNFTLSLLIELFNNEPNLSTYDPWENIHFGSDILDAILRRGSFDSMHEQTKQSKLNRSYADQIKIPAKLDRNELQEMLGRAIVPVFFFCPCYVCLYLKTSLLVERSIDTAEKETGIPCGSECEAKGLPLLLGVREDRVDKKIIDPLAGRIYPQDVDDIYVAVAKGNGEKGVETMQLLTGITETCREIFRNIETDISAKCRLKFHAAHLMVVPAVSTGCTIENIGLGANFCQDYHLNRYLQTLTQTKRDFSDLFRFSFKVGQETNTIILNFSSTEELWRLVQPLQNYWKIRKTTTQRLQDPNRVDVVQYRSSVEMIDVTVDVPGRTRLLISSVPLSLLKMLLYTFSRRFRAVDVQNTFVSIYQVPALFRYGPVSNNLYLKNQNRQNSNENVTFALPQRNSFIFWKHFPRPRDVYGIAMSNTTGKNIDTAATRLGDPEVTNDQQKHDRQSVATGLEVEGAEGYDSFDISEPCIVQKNNEWDHPKGTRDRDYQTFGGNVPDSLTDIQVPTIDITDIQFKTDTDGNRILFVSGGFGDIFQACLSTTEDEVIIKKVKNMTYNDVLRETKIQTYLMTDGFVPKMLGIIGGPGHPETMIVQQMCSKGKIL